MSSVLYATDWLTGSARTRVPRRLHRKNSRSDASRVEGLAERECGARWIEGGEGAVGSTHEAVTPNCVTVEPGDRPCRVDGEGHGVDRGARRIERDEGAVGTPQIGARPVSGDTRDRPSRIDPPVGMPAFALITVKVPSGVRRKPWKHVTALQKSPTILPLG